MDLWAKLQREEIERYVAGQKGVFSQNSIGAIVTGGLINAFIPFKNCLDVGCGLLPLPYYMKVANSVKFTGIDPNDGYERSFNFKAGVGENLPFDDNSFDGVLFATSLDHMKNPREAIMEGKRVLRTGGYMFIWTAIRSNDAKYRKWKKIGKQYDKHHLWGFTQEDIFEMTPGLRLFRKVNLLVNNQGIIFCYGLL